MKNFLVLGMYFASFCFNLSAMENQQEGFASNPIAHTYLFEEYDGTVPCVMTWVTTAQGDIYLIVGFKDSRIVTCRPDGSDKHVMSHGHTRISSLDAITTSQGETYIISALGEEDYGNNVIKIWNLQGDLVRSFDGCDFAWSLAFVETVDHEVVILSHQFNGIVLYNFKGERQKELNDFRKIHGFRVFTTRRGDTLLFGYPEDTGVRARSLLNFDYGDIDKWFDCPIDYFNGVHVFDSQDGNTYLVAIGADKFMKYNIYDATVAPTCKHEYSYRRNLSSFVQTTVQDFHAPCDVLLMSCRNRLYFSFFEKDLDAYWGNNVFEEVIKNHPKAKVQSMKMFTTPQGETFVALGIVKNSAWKYTSCENKDSLLLVDSVSFVQKNKADTE
jgi:hypothetical protein